jgi:RND family efflux transporter MFP subunit
MTAGTALQTRFFAPFTRMTTMRLSCFPSIPRRATALALFTVVVAASAGCSASHEPAAPSDTRAALAVQAAPVVAAQFRESIDAGGIVQARTSAVVSARLLATIREIKVAPGDRVRRGQALVVLDGRDLSAAALQASTARSAQNEGVSAARAELEAARAGQVLARQSHERIAALASRKAATAQELDAATSARAAAEARVTSAEARIRQAESALASAGAASDQAGVMASYATLTAPFDGVITEKLADVGTLAAPGLPILRMEDRSRFSLDIRLDEARAVGLAVGTAVPVSIDLSDGTARPVEATVVELARGIDSGTRTVVAKLGLPSDAGFTSGLFGRAHLPGAAKQGLLIPGDAVVRRGQMTSVFVVDGEHARLRLVTLGRGATASAPGRVEAVSGLVADERVIVNPPAALSDGQRITVTAAATGGAR